MVLFVLLNSLLYFYVLFGFLREKFSKENTGKLFKLLLLLTENLII